jgi:hypothetical protein
MQRCWGGVRCDGWRLRGSRALDGARGLPVGMFNTPLLVFTLARLVTNPLVGQHSMPIRRGAGVLRKLGAALGNLSA